MSAHENNFQPIADDQISWLNSVEAKLVDDELMSEEFGWQMEQLMELAGLTVAQLTFRLYPPCQNNNKVLIYVGPGSS